MNQIVEMSGWDDSLIWCPSQCELSLKYKDKCFVLYLRWRYDDPWTASLIETSENFEINRTSEWHELEIDYWKDSELDKCKENAKVVAFDWILNNII